MKTVISCLISALVSISINAESINDCNDPNFHSLETPESARRECGPAFKNRCYCLTTCYDDRLQYVVNCTNTGFQDTSPLLHLPNDTQVSIRRINPKYTDKVVNKNKFFNPFFLIHKVLIFTGNELEELPWNVFGTLDNLPYLRVIDMSNNNIREIRGKAYHHVQHVERLILNFNKLSLDPARSHPRVFSNFVSLLELHLTNAFETGSPKNLASTLHDIFVRRYTYTIILREFLNFS